ncbi:hypothetical protein GCM10020001_034900 [Nonomuraea salmonea]
MNSCVSNLKVPGSTRLNISRRVALDIDTLGRKPYLQLRANKVLSNSSGRSAAALASRLH